MVVAAQSENDAARQVPVSVIVVTKNEECRIEVCLRALSRFSQVIVVDSDSEDQTVCIAQKCGAEIVNFLWNKKYPKKYGWCLDELPNRIEIKNDYILFIDADEIVTPELCDELLDLDFESAGYFIRGRYILNGRLCRYGLTNNKLCLLHKDKFMFPVVDDLDVQGMGEIEGHYQPVLKQLYAHCSIGQLKNHVIHDCMDDLQGWQTKHERYAHWEAQMDLRDAWPQEVSVYRRILKQIFKALPCRPLIAFLHAYVLKTGFMDGMPGYTLARSRYCYYAMINAQSASLKTNTAREHNDDK